MEHSPKSKMSPNSVREQKDYKEDLPNDNIEKGEEMATKKGCKPGYKYSKKKRKCVKKPKKKPITLREYILGK